LFYVLNQLKKENYEKLHIVIGVVSDKKLETILPMFPKKAIYYFCKPNIPRGMDAEVLKAKAKEYGLTGKSFGSVNQAYIKSLKTLEERDILFIGGSTFVVAEII